MAFEKGRRMEDLVEEMLRVRGFRFERNVRVRGRSGSLHEIDFLVYTRAGPVVYEVKNYSRPAPKEVVIKAFEVARDIGASGVVVVSASGFTEDAVKVARSLGVELADLDSIAETIEAAKAHSKALYLALRVGEDEARKLLESMAKRRLLLFKAESLGSLECVYAPFYYFEGEIEMGEGRYRRLAAAASGLTGLPLAREGRVVYESSSRAAKLPADLLPAYSRVAGRVVTKSWLASELGSGRARRLIASLEAAGLASRLGGRKAMYRVEDDRAPLDALEEAAALLLAPAAHAAPPGCRVLRATLSPGAALSLLSGLYGFTATEERLVYAPVYVGRLESRDGKVYRLVYATGWTGRPLAYRPARSFRA